MGDSSHKPRSRSRSPSRRHRDGDDNRERSKEHRSSHHSSKHHRSSRHQYSDEEEDRKRRHKHDRHETEDERKERKRLKKEKRRGEKSSRHGLDVVDDDDDGAMWVEKDIDAEVSSVQSSLSAGSYQQEAVSNIPTAESLPIKSQVEKADAPLPPATTAGTHRRERDSWMLDPGSIATTSTVPMPTRDVPRNAGTGTRDLTDGYGEQESDGRILDGGVDFFSSLGTEHKRKDINEGKPDPAKPPIDHRELNHQLVEGKSVDEYEAPKEKKVQPGGPGSSWRMMKLKRLYEQAEEE